MQFQTKKIGDVTVNTIQGRVDRVGAAELELILMADVREGVHKIVLDVSEMTYINSTGMRVLAATLVDVRDQGGDLRLVNLHPRVRRVFEIIGFLEFFKVYADVDAAVQAFTENDRAVQVA